MHHMSTTIRNDTIADIADIVVETGAMTTFNVPSTHDLTTTGSMIELSQ